MDSAGRYIPDIMVVDDVATNLQMLTAMLQAQGFRTRPLLSGVKALESAEKAPPDLILLDIAMPDLDGYEVCRRLKANAALSDIPVLFISALSDTAAKVRGFAAGGVDFVTKPFQFEEVEARVRTHLTIQAQKRELRESNDRLQALEVARDHLMHAIVHDLRSPLTGIVGMLELIQRGPVSSETREMVDFVLDSANDLEDMVSRILDVSKMEAGQMSLDAEPCDLKAVAERVVVKSQGLLERKTLTVEGEPCEVTADVHLVSRLLQNLISNALKFTRAGSVRVVVEALADHGKVSVIDTGMGIAPENHARVFERFAQVNQNSKKGAGLGLTFCRLAVEAHGGEIGLSSQLGEGSTFWFTLPKDPRAAVQALVAAGSSRRE